MIEHGANFADCRFDHYPLYTSVGHAVISTGGEPYKTLIVGNEWYDETQHKKVYSVSDPEFLKSPRNLGSTTIGDELKLATEAQSKIVAISLKDRAAILLGGFSADDVFWFNESTNRWETNLFYAKNLPAWVEAINAKLGGKKQNLISAHGNAITWELAAEAVKTELLGKHDVPDLLEVNFSGNDLVGHVYGPDSPEVKRITIASDRQLSQFLNFLQSTVPGGLNSVLLVVTSDHGIASKPEMLKAMRIPGERVNPQAIQDTVEKRLTDRYGEGPWVSAFTPPYLYLNPEAMAHYQLDSETAEKAALETLSEIPSVFAAYGRSQIIEGKTPETELAKTIEKSFVPSRSGNVVVVLRPNAIWSKPSSKQDEHQAPYPYDTHVPLILFGANIKPGVYLDPVKPIDIAPTLAYLLKTQFPSASEGKILKEAIR